MIDLREPIKSRSYSWILSGFCPHPSPPTTHPEDHELDSRCEAGDALQVVLDPAHETRNVCAMEEGIIHIGVPCRVRRARTLAASARDRVGTVTLASKAVPIDVINVPCMGAREG